jgi:hypothetical protein
MFTPVNEYEKHEIHAFRQHTRNPDKPAVSPNGRFSLHGVSLSLKRESKRNAISPP